MNYNKRFTNIIYTRRIVLYEDILTTYILKNTQVINSSSNSNTRLTPEYTTRWTMDISERPIDDSERLIMLYGSEKATDDLKMPNSLFVIFRLIYDSDTFK